MDLITTNVVCMFVSMSQMWADKVHALMPHYRSLIQCPVQSYYDVTLYGKDKCSPCTICPKGFQMKENCTATRDTVCAPCNSGTFNDVIGGECRKCRVCMPGQYTQRHCRAHKDATCRKCPQFTFSSRPNVGVCRYCKTCYQNQEEVLTCMRNRDRKCGRCMTGFFRRSDGGGCLQCSQCRPEVPAHKVKACLHHNDIDPELTCPPTEVAESYAVSSFVFGNIGVLLKKEMTERARPQEEVRTTGSPKKDQWIHLLDKEGKQVRVIGISTTVFTTPVDDLPDIFSWRIAAAAGCTVASFVLLLILLYFFFSKIKVDFLSSPPYVVRI